MENKLFLEWTDYSPIEEGRHTDCSVWACLVHCRLFVAPPSPPEPKNRRWHVISYHVSPPVLNFERWVTNSLTHVNNISISYVQCRSARMILCPTNQSTELQWRTCHKVRTLHTDMSITNISTSINSTTVVVPDLNYWPFWWDHLRLCQCSSFSDHGFGGSMAVFAIWSAVRWRMEDRLSLDRSFWCWKLVRIQLIKIT